MNDKGEYENGGYAMSVPELDGYGEDGNGYANDDIMGDPYALATEKSSSYASEELFFAEETSLLEELEMDPHNQHFDSFIDFFNFLQRKNLAVSIEKPSIKLSRSLRFSGHHTTAKKMDQYIKTYIGSASVSREQVTTRGRDWNGEFQALVELPDSRIKFLGLRNLAHDFVYAAETYGRIIISEHCLPLSMKTIKPVAIGGIAGGLKFICQGILFKFAVDDSGIYGGDENAMKTASHELKGLTSYFHCAIKGLHFPLMSYIDYRGFRLMALSLLPINSRTICYGSADGGRTVHCRDPKMNEIAETLGRMLNLKKHQVGISGKSICGPGDIEGHRGTDNRLYMLDFARVAPPQPPTTKGSQIYNLYRMEYVVNASSPLSSDCFTMFGNKEKENNRDNRRIMEEYLNKFIPHVASLLQTSLRNSEIVEFLHCKGVNLRHIGLVRRYVDNESLSRQLLLEALARSVKSHLNELLRAEMQKCSVPSEKPFRQVVLDLFNLVLGNNELSSIYWNTQLKTKVQQKYSQILMDTEAETNFDLKKSIDMYSLIERLQEITSVTISANAMALLNSVPNEFELVDPDIELQSRVVHLNLIDYADGMALFYEAENRLDNPNTQHRLLSLARTRLESSLSQSGNTNYMAMLQLGNISRSMAKNASVSTDREECIKKATSAFEKLTKGKCNEQFKFQAYFLWAKTLWSEVKKTQSGKFIEEGSEQLQVIQSLIQSSLDIQPKAYCSILLRCKILFHQALYYRRYGKYDKVTEKLNIAIDSTQSLLHENTTRASPTVDCLLMKAKLDIFRFIFMAESSAENLGASELETAKSISETCDQVFQISEDVDLFKHVQLSPNIQLALLSVFQYSPDILLSKLAALMNNKPVLEFHLDETLDKWMPDQSGLPQLLGRLTKCTSLYIETQSSINIATDILKCAEQVEKLFLHSINVSPDSLIEVFKQCGKNVKIIGISDVGFVSCVTDGNKNTDDVVRVFSYLPSRLHSLRVRDLKFYDSTKEEYLVGGFPCTIKEIDFRDIESLSNQFLSALYARLPELETLILCNCKNVTDVAVLQKFESLKKLSVYSSAVDIPIICKSIFPSIETLIDNRGLYYCFNTSNSEQMVAKIIKSVRNDIVCSISSPHCNGEFIQVTQRLNVREFNIRVGQNSQFRSTTDVGAMGDTTLLASFTLNNVGPMIRCAYKCHLTGTLSQVTLTKNPGMNMIRFNVPFMGQTIFVDGTISQNKTGRINSNINQEPVTSLQIGPIAPPFLYVSPQFSFLCLVPLLIPYLIYVENV